jgi:hypothetical protein
MKKRLKIYLIVIYKKVLVAVSQVQVFNGMLRYAQRVVPSAQRFTRRRKDAEAQERKNECATE